MKSMRKKIAAMVGAAALLATVTASSGLAWGGLDGTAACGDVQGANRFSGENGVIAKRQTKQEGVKASFDAQKVDAFLTCHDSSGTDVNSATNAWIAIVPVGTGNTASIIQVGVMRAEAPCAGSWCDGQIHLIASWGYSCPINPITGCGGPSGIGPTPLDFGLWTSNMSPRGAILHYCHDTIPGGSPCDTGTVDYWVLAMTQDGSDPLTWTTNPGAVYQIIHDNDVPWTVTGNYYVQAAFETLDQGDQAGATVSDSYTIYSVQTTYSVGPFVTPTWTTPGFKAPCDFNDFLPTPGGTGVFPVCTANSNTVAGGVDVYTPNR